MPISGLIAGRMSEAFQDLVAQRFREEEQRELQRQREFENAMRLQQMEETKAEREATRAYQKRQEERQARLDELSEAKTITELTDVQYDPQTGEFVPLSAQQAATLAKTPYGARVRTSGPTLEARAVVPELAGSIQEQPQIIRELLPTGAQRAARTKYTQEQATRQELARLAADPNTPPRVRQILNLQRVGAETAPIGVETLKTPEELEAEHQKELEDYEAKQKIAAKYRPPADTSGLTAGRSRLLGQSRLLQNDYQRDVQGVTEMARAYDIMQEGLKAVKEGKGPAGGAQAVLVTFQKILDPTSVVRESEYMRSAAGQALADRLYGQIEQWRVGGAGVPAHELQNFVDLAGRFTQRALDSAKRTRQRYINQAETFGIDPDFVVGDLPGVSEEGAGEPAAAPSAGYERYKQRKGKGQ